MTSSSHTRRDRGLAPPFTPDGPVLVAILGALDDLHDLIAERLIPVQEPAPDDPPDRQPDEAVPVQEPAPGGPPDKQAQPVQEPAPKRAPRKTTPRKQTGKAS